MEREVYDGLLGQMRSGHRYFARFVERLPVAARSALLSAARVRTLAAREVVVNDGDDVNQVGLILDGTLGMTKVLPDGRIHILGLLFADDLFGRIFDGPSGYRIEALSEATILSFDRAPFETVLREMPEVERLFLVALQDELDAAREWVLMMNGTSVVERVASFLLFLARRQNGSALAEDTSLVPVTIPISRTHLAQTLGARPETLSRVLHGLQRAGLLRIHEADRFEITDLGGLLKSSGQDMVLPEAVADRPDR